jgi:hypothetical protein
MYGRKPWGEVVRALAGRSGWAAGGVHQLVTAASRGAVAVRGNAEPV